jgi:hypothetical protein
VVTITCCALGTDAIAGTVTLLGDQLMDDPLLCEPLACTSAPTMSGACAISAISPCTPGGNGCGILIGALGADCTVEAVHATSWGAVKACFVGDSDR